MLALPLPSLSARRTTSTPSHLRLTIRIPEADETRRRILLKSSLPVRSTWFTVGCHHLPCIKFVVLFVTSLPAAGNHRHITSTSVLKDRRSQLFYLLVNILATQKMARRYCCWFTSDISPKGSQHLAKCSIWAALGFIPRYLWFQEPSAILMVAA